MNQNKTETKPADAEQPTDEGLDETPCSAFSGTPETDAQTRYSWLWDTRAMNYHPGGIVVDVDLARKLERERNEWRERCEHMQIACKVWSDQVDALNLK